MSGRVLYVQYTNPGGYPPLEHSAHMLADAGFDVVMLGLSATGEAPRLEPHARIRVISKSAGITGWRQKLHYTRFLLSAVWLAARWRPEWIYASDPLSCPMAVVLRLLGPRVIYHEHDSPASIEAAGESRFGRLVRRARTAVAARAELCILPNERRAEAFRHATGRDRVEIVWNTPARAEASTPRGGGDSGGVRVLYHGSIVPARLPLAILEALARLPDRVSLSVVGYETAGHPGYVRALADRATALGVGHRVHIVGVLPSREDLMRHCATCHVGLSLMPLASADINSREMVGASNKPFDYMACGLALLVSDLPDWRAAFVDPGFARSCDPNSVDSVEQALRWFVDHPAATSAMGARGRETIRRDWNYETAFAPVLARMLAASPIGAAEPSIGRTAPAGASAPAGRDH